MVWSSTIGIAHLLAGQQRPGELYSRRRARRSLRAPNALQAPRRPPRGMIWPADSLLETTLAVSAQRTARRIGQAFADVAQQMPYARRLWVSLGPDSVTLWLLTDALDLEIQRSLYALVDATDPVASGAFVH